MSQAVRPRCIWLEGEILPNGGFGECGNNDFIKRGHFLAACVTIYISGSAQQCVVKRNFAICICQYIISAIFTLESICLLREPTLQSSITSQEKKMHFFLNISMSYWNKTTCPSKDWAQNRFHLSSITGDLCNDMASQRLKQFQSGL
jgi:hypothetical protein